MDMKDLEPNSHKYNREKQEAGKDREKLSPIVEGAQRKRSLGKRFISTFFMEDVKDVKKYLIFDILIPAIKDTLYNMITGGTSMLFYSESKRPGRNGRRGTFIPYDSYGRPERVERTSSYSRTRERLNHSFDDIVLDSRGDCERVLDRMNEIIETYGQVTIADLYDLVDISSEFTDNKFGWYDLKNAGYSRLRDGRYVLDLPKVVDLK